MTSTKADRHEIRCWEMAAQYRGCALVHWGWLGVLPEIPLVFGFCSHRSAALLLWLCASKAR